jgi:hypothetical protein
LEPNPRDLLSAQVVQGIGGCNREDAIADWERDLPMLAIKANGVYISEFGPTSTLKALKKKIRSNPPK